MLLCYRQCFVVGLLYIFVLWGDVMLLRYRLCHITVVLGVMLLCYGLYFDAMLMSVLKIMVRIFVVSDEVLYFATIQYYIFRYTMLCDVVLYYGTLCFVVSYFTLEYRGLLGDISHFFKLCDDSVKLFCFVYTIATLPRCFISFSSVCFIKQISGIKTHINGMIIYLSRLKPY